jgi:hypothetical protein
LAEVKIGGLGQDESVARWPVKRSRGGWLGIGGAVILVALATGGLALAVHQPAGWLALLLALLSVTLLAAAAALALLAAGYFRLAYEFGPDRLVLRSSHRSEAIPFGQVDGIYAGQRIGALRRVRGVSWPGYHVGQLQSRVLGSLRVYCTDTRPDALSVIVAGQRGFVLTPVDPPGFRRELIRRIEASEEAAPDGASEVVGHRSLFPSPLGAALLTAALALVGATLTALTLAADSLPAVVPLQLDPLARDALQSPSSALSYLLILGLGVVLLNAILSAACRSRERAASTLLLSTATLVTAVIYVASLRALP